MAPWASRSETLVVGARVAVRIACRYSVLHVSSSSSDQSTMICWMAGGSLIEIPPLGVGRLFGFFFFFAGSSRACSFLHGDCRCLGGFSTMSSDEDNELLSDGGTAGA